MELAKDQNMIQALASKRPDQPLRIRILPRRSGARSVDLEFPSSTLES
jgi:hypothetical protein